jgi:hypothetical protein
MNVMNFHPGRLPTSQVPVGVLPIRVLTSMLSDEYPNRYQLIAEEFG